MYTMKKLTIDLGDYDSKSKKKSAQLTAAINAVGAVNTKNGMMKSCHYGKKHKMNIDIDLD